MVVDRNYFVAEPLTWTKSRQTAKVNGFQPPQRDARNDAIER
jgi:hypothetical protein